MTPKKELLRKLISVVLFLLMIGLLVWYVLRNRSDFEYLLHIPPKKIIWILCFAFGACFTNCVYHKMILSSYGIQLDFVDWFCVVNVSNALSLVLPLRGDLVFTAAYYKRVKHFGYSDSVSVAAGNIVFSVLFSLLQMLVSLLMMLLRGKGTSPLLWMCWGVATAVMAVFLLIARRFGSHMPEKFTRIPKLKRIVDGFNALLANRRLLLRLLCCLIFNNLFTLLQYMVCFSSAGTVASLDQTLFFNSVSKLCSLVAIVPGNVGIKEAILGAASSLMGDVFSKGVAVSLLHTVSLTVMYIVTGLCCALPVFIKWRKAKDVHEEIAQ